MKKTFSLMLGLMLMIALSSCDYIAPDTSKAISEKQQLEEMQKQTAIMERQAVALEKIAVQLEKK